METKDTEILFVSNFIRKNRRERSISLLRQKPKRSDFINKFNHNWSDMISESNLLALNCNSVEDVFKEVKRKLKFKDQDLCYVIANTNQDEKFVDFKSAFFHCYTNGFASLVICKTGKKFFLKTEQSYGSPEIFIGLK